MPAGANSGVGFAIPVDAVRGSVEQIITTGRVTHPVIGISFAPDAAVEDVRPASWLCACTGHRLHGFSLQPCMADGSVCPWKCGDIVHWQAACTLVTGR